MSIHVACSRMLACWCDCWSQCRPLKSAAWTCESLWLLRLELYKALHPDSAASAATASLDSAATVSGASAAELLQSYRESRVHVQHHWARVQQLKAGIKEYEKWKKANSGKPSDGKADQGLMQQLAGLLQLGRPETRYDHGSLAVSVPHFLPAVCACACV